MSVPHKLAVLALAERVLTKNIRGSINDELGRVELCLGVTWIAPNVHRLNRTIVFADGCMVGFETTRGRSLVSTTEFAKWVRRNGACPMEGK